MPELATEPSETTYTMASTMGLPRAQQGKPIDGDLETEQCGGAVEKRPGDRGLVAWASVLYEPPARASRPTVSPYGRPAPRGRPGHTVREGSQHPPLRRRSAG